MLGNYHILQSKVAGIDLHQPIRINTLSHGRLYSYESGFDPSWLCDGPSWGSERPGYAQTRILRSTLCLLLRRTSWGLPLCLFPPLGHGRSLVGCRIWVSSRNRTLLFDPSVHVRLEINRPRSSWKDEERASGAAFESNLIS
jgi:hypothetical protein